MILRIINPNGKIVQVSNRDLMLLVLFGNYKNLVKKMIDFKFCLHCLQNETSYKFHYIGQKNGSKFSLWVSIYSIKYNL